MLTIFLGNTIVLVPMVLNGHAGAKYGIPFPVLARASFGTRLANLPDSKGDCGMWMVWYPNMDWWICIVPDDAVVVARVGNDE